ncbi:MAG TPA: ABC transporter substrate-binding protein, partial [Microvirga sp.]|nr:ABC transporter substrate-binding protein [Microvirga sp.]
MSFRKLSLGLAAATMLAGTALPAFAQDSIYVPLFTYRTGAFAGSGTYIADGMHDYLEMLNQRDGGIGGVKLVLEECETGYDTKKGVECYESVKGKNPVLVNPWSTGITLPLIPRASVDKIPILSMAYGLSASARGDIFPWIFNPPSTYWDGLSMIIRYIGEKEGGLEKLKGKKIGFIHLDAAFGKEPIPLLQELAKDIGFEVALYPVAAQDMQNQSSQWLSARRDRPDYMIMWGWGSMNGAAVKEAVRSGYPMDKFYSVWWPGEDDARSGGAGAKGFKMLNWHAVGANFPAIQDIQKHVVDKGLSK